MDDHSRGEKKLVILRILTNRIVYFESCASSPEVQFPNAWGHGRSVMIMVINFTNVDVILFSVLNHQIIRK